MKSVRNNSQDGINYASQQLGRQRQLEVAKLSADFF